MDTYDKKYMVEYCVSGVSILLMSLVGVIGNIVCGIVMRSRQKESNQTVRDLLVCLAMVDSVFLVLVVILFSLPQFSSHYRDFVIPYIVPSVLPCTSVAMTGSLYLVVSLCVERVLAMPGISMGNKGALLGYILPTALFAIFYNLPKFFALSTRHLEDENGFMPYIHPTSFQQNQEYSYFVLGADLIFLGIVPMCVLLSCVALLYRGGGYSNIYVYVIVAIQLASHAPRNALNICDIYQSYNNNNNNNNHALHPHWLLDISHLLLTISSSITVIIFTAQERLISSKMIKSGNVDREVTNKLLEDTNKKTSSKDVNLPMYLTHI